MSSDILGASNTINRRGFLAGAAVGAGSLVVRPAFADSIAKKGGHLVLSLDGGNTNDTLDPATYISTFLYTVGYQWGNCLVEIGEKGELIPELAESWEPNSDATIWTFKTRKGVTFHNGKTFRAEDAIYSIDYHRGKKSTSPMAELFKPIVEIKNLGENEFRIELREPNADLPALLADYHMLIMPLDGDPRSGIGTGGYIIDKFEPGVRLQAHRNPDYWKPGRAHVDTIETLSINDATTRAAALQAGRIHLMNNPDPATVRLLQRSPNVTLVNIPSSGFYTMPMRCDTAPFNNKDVRLALKYALDRKEIVEKVLGGFAEVGNDHPISAHDPYFNPDIPQYTYDPDKAAFHIKKSGETEPVVLSMCNAAFAGGLDAAALYKEQARRAGIEIKIERVTDDGYWSDTWLKKPFFGGYWTGRPAPDIIFSMTSQSSAPWNEAKYVDDKFDKLLSEARGELKFEKRKEIYHTLQSMVHDDSGLIVPLFRNYLFATSKSVDGISRGAVFTGYRLAEQIYFV